MTPRGISEWRTEASCVQDFQVEQNLVISGVLVEIFSKERKGGGHRGGVDSLR